MLTNFLIVYLFLSTYLLIRGNQALPRNLAIRIVYSLIYILVSSTVLIGLLLKDELPKQIVNFSKLVGGFWSFLFIGFLLAAFFGDFLRIVNHFFKISFPIINRHYSTVKLWYLFFVIFILSTTALIGFYCFNNTRITDLAITTKRNGYQDQITTILVASDMHIGNIVRIKKLAKWVEQINSQQSDIVILAGDQFDGNFDESKYGLVSKEISKIQAKFGVYAVLGNQEYYINTEKAIQCMEQAGIIVLRDSSLTIDSKLILIGRDDSENPERKAIDSLLSGLDNSLPWILINHNPSLFHESYQNKIDLHISGHLHNGQIFPYNYIIKKNYKYSYGYKKIENTHFYISSGLGVSFVAMRLGTRSEMNKISFIIK